MASLHASELDTDSVASSPRSDQHMSSHDPRVRFMCSFGGKILPRPHDNQLRYVGGDTRIVAVHRSTTYSTLLTKLSKLSGIGNLGMKYQLPNEDLDALISVTTDEDVENMMEEYDRLLHNQNPRSARLRLFLFPTGEDSQASSISSLLDGSANREDWFFDALNSGSAGLERGRSEASSIASEVPDYLFGLDHPDETQVTREPRAKSRLIMQDNVSVSDPGSPAPIVSSPYCSTSSAVPTVPSIPDLPPVKIKPENLEPVIQRKVEFVSEPTDPQMAPSAGYPSTHPIQQHYMPDPQYSGPPIQPIRYVPGLVPPGNVPVQPAQPVQLRPSYVQQYPVSVSTGQLPVTYQQPVQNMGQVYSGVAVRPMTTMNSYDATIMVPDGMNQQVYYGVRNASAAMVPGHPGMVMPVTEDLSRPGFDPNTGRFSQ
uniref:Uncharacterized protein MANES_16G019200 n=1 Tax=Rhizophora mucronata TaxID=61149 RepID=A0A2P2IH10_RHIMU